MSSPSGGLPHPALADVTNQTRKRAFKGCGGSGVEEELEDVRVSKQVCLGSVNFGFQIDSKENLNKNDLPPCEENLVGHVAGEVEVAAAVDKIPVNGGIVDSTNAPCQVIEVDAVSRHSCCSVPLIAIGSDSCSGDSGSWVMFQKSAVRTPTSGLPLETSLLADCQNGKDIPAAYFNLDESESSESVKPSKIQSFELERCTSLKGDNDSNSAASAADMLKTCFCSFCLKAAYIWSDLHYQDVKGRISAAKKSKKEAVNSFHRICMVKEANAHGQGISERTSKLDFELSSQWRSLFLHMEESFARETNHLQDNLLALKDLRENCKVNLEMIDAKPADRDEHHPDCS